MAPIYGPGGVFRGAVATRVPVENLRTIFEQEGRLRYGQDIYDWLLLTREGVILSEKHPDGSNVNRCNWRSLTTRTAINRDQSGFVEETHHRHGDSVVTGYASTRDTSIFRARLGRTLPSNSREGLCARRPTLMDGRRNRSLGHSAADGIRYLGLVAIGGRERNELIHPAHPGAVCEELSRIECRSPTICVRGLARSSGAVTHGQQLHATHREAVPGKLDSDEMNLSSMP